MKNKVLELSQNYEQEICQFLIDIVNIPSTSCNEKRVVERIVQEMKKVNFDEVRVDGLGNVIGRIGNGSKILAFDAHIDTVDIGYRSLWDFDPYDSKIENGYIHGRGTADQKGGMAAMVYAGKIIKELNLFNDFTIYFTGTVMEEDCDGLCWQYLVDKEKLKPDFVVITEPTNLVITRGQRGRMEMNVSVIGRSAHGSAPERGDNAIYKMTGFIQKVEKLNERLSVDPFLGKGTIAVTQITSGSPSLCAIPDSCSIHLDRRLTWGETKESAIAEIKDIIDGTGAEVKVLDYNEKAYTGLIYPTEKYYPTWKLDQDHPLIQAATENYRNLFDSNPKIDKWTFSTNGVAISGMNGIPCVGFGPGQEEMAHAPNEKVPVEHLVKACAFYALFPKNLDRNNERT